MLHLIRREDPHVIVTIACLLRRRAVMAAAWGAAAECAVLGQWGATRRTRELLENAECFITVFVVAKT